MAFVCVKEPVRNPCASSCYCHCRGLLIRGGDVLEATSQVDTVVFDKTGTLTLGRPCLQAALPSPDSPFSPALLLAYAAAVERCTTHPVAQAIVHAANRSGGNLGLFIHIVSVYLAHPSC